jgi:hypothetical protein
MWRRIVVVAGVLLFPFIAYGEYTLITDRFHYSNTEAWIGAVAWPYPIWVTGTRLYRLASTTQMQREIEDGCLAASVPEQIPRKQAAFICQCMMTKQDFSYCSVLATQVQQ